MARNSRWDIDVPFYIEIDVAADDIDRLDHVNNSVYVTYMERAAWAHTLALGLDWDAYIALDAACVVRRHELDYLIAARLGDRLQVATWIGENDGRVSMWRCFQIRRAADGRTIFRARTQYVTVGLSNGRPRRMPAPFVEAYAPVGHR
ncbi:thioesterase family protein [Salinisphaera sp.]|uniref:acyl-CoA thioesterase n=1 Tax=Salinisphaera sp. TaxID=1914330 RepID=UPI002D7A3FF2|nr:thioesterase family protein [Salinisphaera sp.]HET7315335.1 thioesterase family protein [Salinisphaera sp.]